MNEKRRIIFYQDELNDEFSRAKIRPRTIDASYRYDRSRFLSFIIYRLIGKPLAFLYVKCKYGQKLIGAEKWKQLGKQGAYLYGNHTQADADPLIPNLIRYPGKVFTVCHPNNVSIPLVGGLMPYAGAIPLPDDMTAWRNFIGCIGKRIKEGSAVCIYPEAHIWPYYTGIRPFPDTSFSYPCRDNAPVFCFTNTYVSGKHGGRPRIITYLDGPFYPDASLPPKPRAKALRDKVYQTMTERARLSNTQYVQYIKKG
ncbi:MAG: hypothetical protein IJR83_07865 [Clostridia bacterium]|nr:hypothetical protein [Clostridia bacterium]